MGLVPHPHVVGKNWEGYPGSKRSQPHTRPSSPGFQCQEDPITSGCKNQWGLRMRKTNFLSPRQFLLKGLYTDLFRLIPSEPALRQQLERHRRHWAGAEVYGIRARTRGVVWGGGGGFSQIEVLAEATVPFLSPPHRAGRQAAYLRLHQLGSQCVPNTSDFLRLGPAQLSSPPKLFYMNGLSWLMF